MPPKNKELRAKYNKAYRLKNLDRLREKEKAYDLAHAEERRAKWKIRAKVNYKKSANNEHHKEYRRKYQIEYQKTHEECRERGRVYRLKVKYGISHDDYKEMFANQNGKCMSCGDKPEAIRLAVDHDHQTGKIRGLLCFRCNMALGLLNDDPEKIIALYSYLKKHFELVSKSA